MILSPHPLSYLCSAINLWHLATPLALGVFRGHSRPLEVAPFDIVTILLSFPVLTYSKILVKNRQFPILHVFGLWCPADGGPCECHQHLWYYKARVRELLCAFVWCNTTLVTNGRKHGFSIYHTSTASRGKYEWLFFHYLRRVKFDNCKHGTGRAVKCILKSSVWLENILLSWILCSLIVTVNSWNFCWQMHARYFRSLVDTRTSLSTRAEECRRRLDT